MNFRNIVTAFLIGSLLTLSATAKKSKQELARISQNPVGNMSSLPFQYNLNFNVGPDNDEQSILNIQPVYPININEDWNWINRVIIPVIDQPSPVNKSGLGDIQYQGFLTPTEPGKIIWGLGPVISIPTASDDLLGSEKWSGGAGLVLLKMKGPWVFGSIINNIWSFEGSDDREDVNAFFWQYFINYNLPGFYFTSAPAITADWKADSSDRWTIPFGGGVGKIIKIGKLPVNCQLNSYYNVEHPDGGADWQVRAQVQLMFPK